MATDEQRRRLANVVGWLRTAKENLPAINDGAVAPDHVAEISGLLDRMHQLAVALQERLAQPPHANDRERRAA